MHRASDLLMAHALMERRRARLRRTRHLTVEQHERRSLRRWLGRRLVSLGSRLANEPVVMRPARAR